MKTLKYAVRFLLRAKSYTTINLLGLTLSLACCIILSRYIYRETTVDMHCIDRNQVYGVQVSFDGNRVQFQRSQFTAAGRCFEKAGR